MKRAISGLSLVIVTLGFTGCGSSEAGNPGAKADGKSAPAAAEKREEKKNNPVPRRKVDLDANKLDLNKPIPVADLKDAVMAWDNQEVAVIGYVHSVFSEASIGGNVELLGDPGRTKSSSIAK